MTPLEIIKRSEAYASGYEKTPVKEQKRAKQLCWEYNRTSPSEQEKRCSILQELLGTYSPLVGIEPDFHCDYGFNIHIHGFAFINYNCVILDTSPEISVPVHLLLPACVWLVQDTQWSRNSAAKGLGLQHRLR